MKKKITGLMLWVLGLSIAAAPFAASASAKAENVSAQTETSVFTDGKKGTLTIRYLEGGQKNEAVAGAHFTLYKLAEFTSLVNRDTQIGTKYRSVIPGLRIVENTDQEITVGISLKEDTENISPEAEYDSGNSVRRHTFITVDSDPAGFGKIIQTTYRKELPENGKIYKGKTDRTGCLVIKDIEPAAYLLVEEKAAENHYKSVPALVSVPEMSALQGSGQEGWNYDLTVEPKAVPAGKLILSKKVAGNRAEKNRAFHFRFTITGADAGASAVGEKGRKIYLDPKKLSYPYRTSDGKTGRIRNGELLSLKPGRMIQISMLPAGARYRIREEEANRYGYQTESEREQGYILREKTVHVKFINSRTGKGGLITGRQQKPLRGTAIPQTGKVRPVKTGDRSERFFLYAAAAAAAALVLVLAVKKRKEKTDEI